MSKFSNELTDGQLERLAILSEELGEAQQAIGKIIRHGYESKNPTIPLSGTNRESLERELGDVLLATEMLAESFDLSIGKINLRRDEKAKKIKPYLHHQ